MTDFLDRHDRLKTARLGRGLKTARAASEYLGVPYGTYSGHENGSRGIKDADIVRYANAFRVSASWLAFGQDKGHKKIAIIGVAGSIDQVDEKISRKAIATDVTPPFPVVSDARAVVVSTEEYEPILSKDDVVLIGPETTAGQLAGQRVAISSDKKILLGTLLSASQSGKCHFQLFTGKVFLETSPDWIAPIIGIIFGDQSNA